MFNKDRNAVTFQWSDLGDLELGRPNLGPQVPVRIYRMYQYTLRDVMIAELGVEKTNEIIIKSGRLAGMQFFWNMLEAGLEFNEFISQLQRVFKEQAIGILRFEASDFRNLNFTLTVGEDLECSGLPLSDEVVCKYDEGFFAGILEAYTGEPFLAKEVDCWASGERVCRFVVKKVGDGR